MSILYVLENVHSELFYSELQCNFGLMRSIDDLYYSTPQIGIGSCHPSVGTGSGLDIIFFIFIILPLIIKCYSCVICYS